MFKFGGWKASLNLGSAGRRREIYESGPELSAGGAYRTHREEFFGRGSLSEPPKKLTPSMVKLPPSKEALKPSKSSNELSNPYNLPQHLVKSTPDVSTDPKGGTSYNRDSSALYQNAKNKKNSKDEKRESKKQEKEQKDAEKKRVAEQKKKEKLAAQEQAKQDKLRIQRDRQIAQQQARDVKARREQEKRNKSSPMPMPQAEVKPPDPAPIPPPLPKANPLARPTPYSTNTLESSISRSSGPPPYSELTKPEKQSNNKDSTGNTSFSKPIESSSWDMISAHRNQIRRNPVASSARSKQMIMDLQFSFDKAQSSEDRNNSDV